MPLHATRLSLAVLALLLVPTTPAAADRVAETLRVPMSDGVTLEATVSGEAPLVERPVVVEVTPYGRAGASFIPGPGYNHLVVQTRGTGGSDGSFDALGPRTQADVAEVAAWACAQPWSDGRLGLYGFSASAITIYNSLHRVLPCVNGAVLKSGTFELYRDLLVPGGVNNIVPGAAVIGAIGGLALAQGSERLARDPSTSLPVIAGLTDAGLQDINRPTLDGWWRERGFRGDANDLPILMVNGFFDVESRGAFQAFQELRDDGAHLIVTGAHDGIPAGTDGGLPKQHAWFDRHVRGVLNGVQDTPRVDALLADGSRETHLAGRVVRVRGDDWPLPGTRWVPLALDPARSGTARSLNDGSLRVGSAPDPARAQSFPAVPSLLTSTDLPTTALLGAAGLDALTAPLGILTDMTLTEPLRLSYTTDALAEPVSSAGPASLEIDLASTGPETAIWAVVSDVHPDGSAHPVATGRLSSAFPDIDRGRSLTDPRSGAIVQPYGRFDRRDPAAPGTTRRYRVELWPIGNRFRAGHRIRVHLVGASIASLPGVPGVSTVTAGGEGGSRLLLPVLRGSDLRRALGAAPEVVSPLVVKTAPRRLRAGRARTVVVRVRSDDPTCVRGATVRLAGRRVRTDAQGRATLRLRVRRRGVFRVTATHPDCATGRTRMRATAR
jgi:predicted acyl esterase